jgi:Protein of unknown function (DUF4231)
MEGGEIGAMSAAETEADAVVVDRVVVGASPAEAAAIPVAAGASAPAWLVGGAGALIVVLEGLQQLQQYQQNWITYRSTCERLKHEKFLFAARAGPYASSEPEALLAERVESLVSQKHAAWMSQREEAARRVGNSQ